MSRGIQKELTRQKILEASGRVFKKSGFAGIGIDGLAKEAGVTSGAFYVHFSSKAQAFHEALLTGLSELEKGITYYQEKHRSNWWQEFVSFYLSEKRTCDLTQGCSLQALAGDVSRADSESKKIFADGLTAISNIIVGGPESQDKPADINAAYFAIISLIGGVTLSRSVEDQTLGNLFAQVVQKKLCPNC